MDHKRFGFNECTDLPKARVGEAQPNYQARGGGFQASYKPPPRPREAASNGNFHTSYSSQDVRHYQSESRCPIS